ncbi:hypothetical protein [Lacisediminihabitans changchengi]|uniref:DUF7847 domain-containing protein n=1 Tax=Lacisediminihabitans changchengi TaxID=2787634 RepID=A0A934SK57_9MICO|nr:hypothetical protein [Lacisediminihabitans changchengi]MBK4346407.1 hypothetical protein [Lacisediminihabitans changchengi]
MSEDQQQWQAPDAAAPVPPPAPADPNLPTAPPPAGYTYQPPAGYTAAQATGAPVMGSPAMGTPGWTPPPKPGLIPLRPLTLGDILGSSFRVLRRNPRATFGVSLLLQGIVTIVTIVVVGLVTFSVLSRVDFSTTEDAATIMDGAPFLIGLAALIPILFSVVIGALLQGIVVLEVSRAAVGEKQRAGALFRRLRGRIGALIGWSAIVAGVVLVAVGILVGLIVLFVATLGTAGIVLAVLLGLVGLLGGLVLYFWLGTRLSLVPSAIVLERLSIRDAFIRSWTLTRGYFWRTLGIELLVAVILNVAAQIASAPVSFLSPIIIGIVDPNGQNGPTTIAITVGVGVLTLILSLVVGSIVAVVQAAATALIYLDLRIRTEGLDLELARFVEARQSGEEPRDPYLPSATA